MTKATDKLLGDIIHELQQVRVQLHQMREELRTLKAEVVLTVKATPRRRRKRRRPDPSSLIV